MSGDKPEPFRVMYCAAIALALGKSAQNLRELRDFIADVPIESISHHFFGTLLRPEFDDPEYRNDFAIWSRRQLHDAPLGERLAVIDPLQFESLETLRQHMLDLVDDRLAELSYVPQVGPGLEFHFLRSQLVVLDTGLRAETPEELAALVPRLTKGNIYIHFVEARRQPPIGVDDFSAWLEKWGPSYEELRRQIMAIDFFQWSLSEMRDRLLQCFAPLPAAGGAGR